MFVFKLMIDWLKEWSCSSAGTWFFIGRRWLDPSNPIDAIKLDYAYRAMTYRFPFFSTVSKSEFLDIIFDIGRRWKWLCQKKNATQEHAMPVRYAMNLYIRQPYSMLDDALEEITSAATPMLKPYPSLTSANYRLHTNGFAHPSMCRVDRTWDSITWGNSGETVDILLACL